MKSIKEVLMERDGMSAAEADDLISECKADFDAELAALIKKRKKDLA